MRFSDRMAINLLVAITTIDLIMAAIIDLSHDISMDAVMSPGNPGYNRTILQKGDLKPGVYVAFNKYSIGEHGNTHIDVPKHFNPDGKSLSDIPLEDTILEGVMVDCSSETSQNSEYAVAVEKLEQWEKSYGKIPDRAAVIFNFNWSSKFADPNAYYGTNNLTDVNSYKFPYISEQAGNWMVKERNVKAIAFDVSSPDAMTGNYPVHQRFLLDNRLIVENLKDPALLPPRHFMFHFSPVKFVGATGVQVRAYAVTYSTSNHAPRLGGWFVSVYGLSFTFILSLIMFGSRV